MTSISRFQRRRRGPALGSVSTKLAKQSSELWVIDSSERAVSSGGAAAARRRGGHARSLRKRQVYIAPVFSASHCPQADPSADRMSGRGHVRKSRPILVSLSWYDESLTDGTLNVRS